MWTIGDPTSPPACFSQMGNKAGQTHRLAKSTGWRVLEPELGTSSRVLPPRPMLPAPHTLKETIHKKITPWSPRMLEVSTCALNRGSSRYFFLP